MTYLMKSMIRTLMLAIFLLPLISLSNAQIRYLNVTVDQVNGSDTSGCLVIDGPSCSSIMYVMNHAQQQNITNVSIELLGNYTLRGNITLRSDNFTYLQYISVFSRSNTTITSPLPNASFHFNFKPSDHVTVRFESLVFLNFGRFVTAVIVSWGTDLIIEFCLFLENHCATINSFDGLVYLSNNRFVNNTANGISKGEVDPSYPCFPNGDNSASGGVAIFFSEVAYGKVKVVNNTFMFNRAVTLSSSSVLTEGDSFLAFSHIGGALLLAFLQKASYTYILISNNTFEKNEASIGGGLMMSFHNVTGYNDVIIDRTTFMQNTGTVSGGGMCFMAWKRSSHNKVIVKNSLFSFNFAQVGGAVKVLFQSADIEDPTSPAYQVFKFFNITFHANQAASACGVHLCYNLARTSAKPAFPVIFNNVKFTMHKNVYYRSARHGPSAYSGVLLCNRVDIMISGGNLFSNNSFESPIYLSNSDLHLNGFLKFLGNFAQTSGGGLSLADVSHVILSPNSNLVFQENYAQIQGGGMFVKTIGFPDMVYRYNPSCFLQYEDPLVPASKWNVNISFIKNGAGLKGAALFANTITPCIWDEIPPFFNFRKTFRWNHVFRYEGNYLTNSRFVYHKDKDIGNNDFDIATDTTHFNMGFSQGQVVTASPGEKISFYLAGYDELSNPVYSVPVASNQLLSNSTNKTFIQLDQQYFVIKPFDLINQSISYSISKSGYESLSSGHVFSEKIHFVDSYSTFLSNASFILKLMPCKPGFIYHEGRCICNMKIDGVVRCEDEIVYFQLYYWAYVSRYGEIITAKCPPKYCTCNYNETKEGCAFNYKNPNLQCGKNRAGILCGVCDEGTGINLMTNDCVSCSDDHMWSFLILAVLAMIVIAVAVGILILNPRFSAHMRGIIFFLQMVPYACSSEGNAKEILLTIVSWVGLGGVNTIPLNGCLFKNFNSLDVISLGYSYPVLITFVLFVIYVLHKKSKITFRRDSPFQSVWILVVVAYKFAVETSLLLLFCIPFNGTYVFYYDGSIQCFAQRHLIMTCVAIAVLVLAMHPPIYVVLVVRSWVKTSPAISDGFAQGVRPHVQWWWSLDFLRRIAFISIYVFLPDWYSKQTALLIASVVVLTLHSHTHPYLNEVANKGETFLLLVLTCLVALESEKEVSAGRYWLQVSLIILSIVYCLSLSIYLCFMFCLKIFRSRFRKSKSDSRSKLDESFCSDEYDIVDENVPTTPTPFLRRILTPNHDLLNHRRALPSPTITRTLLAEEESDDGDDVPII